MSQSQNYENHVQDLEREVRVLEQQLEAAKRRLNAATGQPYAIDGEDRHQALADHTLLLLSDSALPLGSFAFSSGLESYTAHHSRSFTYLGQPRPSLDDFLQLSLSSLASTALPYVLAAYRVPGRLLALDDEFDASLPCAVARRASVSQGRALLMIWHRSYSSAIHDKQTTDSVSVEAICALERLRTLLSSSPSSSHGTNDHDGGRHLTPSAHFPPIWAVVARLMHLSLRQSAYVFLLNHVKAILGAAVRSGEMGSYQAQVVLVESRTRQAIDAALTRHWNTSVENAGQVVPILDLWMGRHELLYSRIFNS